MITIIAGSRCQNLAGRIAGKLNDNLKGSSPVNCRDKSDVKLIYPEFKIFPDGEIYVKIRQEDIDYIDNSRCAVVQSMYPGVNDAFVELMLMLDLVSDYCAKSITSVVPYLGYARADKRFCEGEAVSAKTILKMIYKFSDNLITVNCHFFDEGGRFNYSGMDITNLDAFPLVANHFNGLEKPALIAPDKGSRIYAKAAADVIGCDFGYLNKTRISGKKVVMEKKVYPETLRVEGADVVILDDMISTGGTIIEASNVLRTLGAGTINVGCVHGVFSNGVEIFEGVIDSLVCTDTIERGESAVSVSSLVCDEIASKF